MEFCVRSEPTIVRQQYDRGRLVKIHGGVTLIELLVVVAIIGVMVGLLVPAAQQVRESARRISCSSNLRQLSFATLNFHSSRLRFPAGCELGQGAGWSAFILDQLEVSAIADTLNLSDSSGAVAGPGTAGNWTAGGGAQPRPNNLALREQLSVFRCPSDQVSNSIDSGSPAAFVPDRYPSSYLACSTGTTSEISDLYLSHRRRSQSRDQVIFDRNGLLVPTQEAPYFRNFGGRNLFLRSRVAQDDCTDGLSNTILIGETVFDSSPLIDDSMTPPSVVETNRGLDHWCIGSPQVDQSIDLSEFVASTSNAINLYHQFSDAQLIRMSNSARDRLHREMAAGFASWHAGNVVNFALGDGSIHTIEAKIEPAVYARLGNRADGRATDVF